MAPKIFNIATASDYSISTWLLLGATLQSILVASLPRTISLLPPIVLITYRLLHSYLIAIGRLANPITKDIIHGRQTWQIPTPKPTNHNDPNPSESTTSSIVILVLAASWSHPNGRFSPGSQQLGAYFTRMWDAASANRSTYGFLGNTPGLSTHDTGARSDEQGKTVVYLSYWKTLAGLHRFAHGPAHMQGQMWWEQGAAEAFPHIGIMHETYEVPAGGWENVLHNFRPFGMGNAKYPIPHAVGTKSEGVEDEDVEWVSGLRMVEREDGKTMYGRMGRKVGTPAPAMK
ncbi:hypothetical protein IAQ61_007165 [Plenodomus lingam]|uniref:Uncharacterized protein n=1 Tax=Leptosphaeria maculans (strain JN3 / isolate v23.1.3 / race Av1-4-5-6-7-8) TaxID=985895 RepID=E5A1F5_LEPMJ|nr:hypothetical protein LEMA_P105500.1 [Plenodomus lingam JN3]KAH9867861.1 hypothetical protein IAQ61_007165 [Plenodomus lingam]CBX97419.1 hypothetical protein LEMA_P105500.1 [Plenodomus lingam JN3]